MRIYELVFICKPDLTEEAIDEQVAAVQTVIEEGGGKVDKTDKWGKKRLAYRVQKYADGIYVLIQYSLEENLDLPKEIERRLRVSDAVIKFLTVRIDEDLKRIAKAKAAREKRAARKPAAAAPARPAPARPGPGPRFAVARQTGRIWRKQRGVSAYRTTSEPGEIHHG